MSFRIGQRVACIRDDWGANGITGEPSRPDFPRRGRIYVVSDRQRLYGKNFIALHCVVASNLFFLAAWFRPVTEKKTDISVFRALLNPANHKTLENV